MKVRNGLGLAALVLCSSSYSDTISDSVTTNDHVWNPQMLLPPSASMRVDGFVYGFSVSKPAEEALTTTLTTENNLTGGLLLEDFNDFGGISESQYEAQVVIPNGIPREVWGPSSFEINGNSERVSDFNATYFYSFDPCFDNMLSDPSCPGYMDAKNALEAATVLEESVYDPVQETIVATPEVETVDVASATSVISIATAPEPATETEPEPEPETVEEEPAEEEVKEETSEETTEEETSEEKTNEENSDEESSDKEPAEERSVEEVKAEAFFAQTAGADNVFDVYSYVMQGGVYPDAGGYDISSNVPDNRRGLRMGLASQILHDQMVKLQYVDSTSNDNNLQR